MLSLYERGKKIDAKNTRIQKSQTINSMKLIYAYIMCISKLEKHYINNTHTPMVMSIIYKKNYGDIT